MPIEIDDADLDATPYGNFLLAIAEAVDAMAIDAVGKIHVNDFADEPTTDQPEVYVLPLPEEPIEGMHLGRYNALFAARLVEMQKADPAKRQKLGWRIKQRDRFLRRLGGQKSEGAKLYRGNYCFHLIAPTPGPLLDDQSRGRGFARSEIIVRGEYRGA